MAQKSLDMMYNEETISQAINTKWAGKTVHFAKEIDSTMRGSRVWQKKVRSMELWQLRNISQRAEAVLREDGKHRKAVPL